MNLSRWNTSSDIIDTIYRNGRVEVEREEMPDEIWPNRYLILANQYDAKQSCIAKIIGIDELVTLKCIKSKELGCQGILPKDKYQTCFLDSLHDPEILLSVGVGEAGTGKTTLALAYAFHQYEKHERKIILVKPTAMVSNSHAFGPVPGDINEKYAPYLTSFEIVLDKLLSKKNAKSYLSFMREKGDLEFFPVELVRGCTFEHCTVIVDEAQNLSWHETKTLVTRLGDESKMIILGDPNQVDIDLPYSKTGLAKLIGSQVFKDSRLTSTIELENQYRSPIVSLIGQIDKELNA